MHQLVRFFLHLHCENFSISTVKGYHLTSNHLFTIKSLDLSDSKELSMPMSNFDSLFTPQGIQPPWCWEASQNCHTSVFMLLQTRIQLSTCVLPLALALVKCEGIWYPERGGSCTFSFSQDSVTKTQNLLVPYDKLDGFMISYLLTLAIANMDDVLLCPVHAVRSYIRRMQQYNPAHRYLLID